MGQRFHDGDELRQARDKAVLLVGFYGAMRRSEIAGLDVEDLNFNRLGLLITLRKSKTDQFDQGQTVAIPYIEDKDLCAVRALQHWLDLSGITTGPVFRSFTKGHHIRKARISDKTIALIVKRYVGLMGMDPAEFGAHSLRLNFDNFIKAFQTADMGRAFLNSVMRQTRHRSTAVVRKYIDEADRLIDNPILKIARKK